MNSKLKIIILTLLLVVGIQVLRFHQPVISGNQIIDKLSRFQIELSVSKKIKKGNRVNCREILPLVKVDAASSIYQIITDPNTVLIVSVQDRNSNS